MTNMLTSLGWFLTSNSGTQEGEGGRGKDMKLTDEQKAAMHAAALKGALYGLFTTVDRDGLGPDEAAFIGRAAAQASKAAIEEIEGDAPSGEEAHTSSGASE